MHFNLIDEQWIPVKRRDGEEVMIAPWQITEGFYENPIVSLNAPRPDFNGALIQFLIGLVQTTAAPANRIEWKTKLNKPLTPQELKIQFSTVRHAFDLGGDGPRFMQDFEKLDVEERGIDGLLIDMPGESAKKKNTDHFVKRATVKGLCPACCSATLFTMQTNAPAGGAGFRTSLRGGGPLSTLIIGDDRHDTLWHLLWLNLLESDTFQQYCGNLTFSAESKMFPWLAKTRTSEANTGVATTPEDAHPALMFWAIPRRIKINLDEISIGECNICGKSTEQLILKYQDKNYGMNFSGAWLHILSPYTYNKDGLPLPTHAQPGGVSYRHWLGFVQEDGSEKRMPARVVHTFRNIRQNSDWQFRLWAFGYDMDNMKARCWYEAKMPLIYIDSSFRGIYEQCVAGLIKTATEIAYNVRTGIKAAWFKRPADAKGDFSFLGNSFWQSTEPAFYATLNELKTSLESGSDDIETLRAWHAGLCREALKLFDAYALECPIEDADPKRVVLARRKLEWANHSNKIRELLGLLVGESQAGNAARKKPKKQ